jgi:hypothetical protein
MLFFSTDPRNIDKIQDIVDDARDVMEQYEEIGNVLTQPINGQGFDEDDLLEELNQIDEERISEQILDIGSVSLHGGSNVKGDPSHLSLSLYLSLSRLIQSDSRNVPRRQVCQSHDYGTR